MDIVDEIWEKCRQISDATLHVVRNGDKSEYMSDWPLAFSEFNELLTLFCKYVANVLMGKTYSDETAAPLLLTKGIDINDTKRAEEPLRVHLYILSQFAKELNKVLKKEYSERYKTLYLDTMTDIQAVVGAYEYVLAVKSYKKQCCLFQLGKASNPPKPQLKKNTIGRNPEISAFDRKHVINFLFWAELFDNIDQLSFRDLRPHSAILIRQALELIWHNVIGYEKIIDSNGNILKQFTQVGWNFIREYKNKTNPTMASGTDNSWSIILPISINTIHLVNNACNGFTHDPWIKMLHVQWFILMQYERLSAPGSYKGFWTTAHGNITIEGLKCMQSEFEAFVAQENYRAHVVWPTDRHPTGAFVISEGQQPNSTLLNNYYKKQLIHNIKKLGKNLIKDIIQLFKSSIKTHHS